MSTQGQSVSREAASLARLAVPLALGHLGTHLMGVVDTAVIGRFSETALAAVGLGNSIYFAMGVLGMGVMLGLDPIISQAVGAREDAEAHTTFWQGLWLALILTLPIVVLIKCSTWLLQLTPIEADVVRLATEYVDARILSVLPFFVFLGARSFLQSYDVTRPFVIAVVLANLINLPLNIILVFGDHALATIGLAEVGIPSFGVRGAGWATFIAASVQMIVMGLSAFRRRPQLLKIRRGINPIVLRRALRVGIPISLTIFAEVAFFSVTGVMAAWLGSRALAAHNVALTLAGTTFQVAMALGTAASVRVGQSVGAGDTPRARLAGFIALAMGVSWMSLGAILFLFIPTGLAALMTDEPGVLKATGPLIMTAAAFQLVDGAQAVMNGALRGAGDTRFAFLANAAGHYLLGLPFAVIAAFVLDWGAVGLWWGLCAGLAAVSMILTARFWIISARPIARI